MMPAAVVEHQLPGRVRLKFAAKRGDTPFFASAVSRLAEIPGVAGLRANPLTGSLVVEHKGDFGEIARRAGEHGLFELKQTEGAQANKAPEGRISNAAVPPLSLAALGFSGASLYQVTQGRYLGNAVENLWNAYGAYTALGKPRLALLLAGIGVYQLLNGQLLGPAATLMFYAVSAQHLAQTKNPEAIA